MKLHHYKLLVTGLLLLAAVPAWGNYKAGLQAYERHDYPTALKELKGDSSADAAYLLAIIHFKGEGVPADKKEGVRWLRQAAEKGHIRAQNNLGVLYDKGDGVERNLGEAAKWYRKAAEQGHVQSQYNLGLMYTNGEGVPKNRKEAVKWLKKAAAKGHGPAQKLLGVMGER